MKRRVLSFVLALVLVAALIPASALPVSAAKTQITGIYAYMRDSDVPLPGMEVTTMAPGFMVSDSNQYTAVEETGFWCNSAGEPLIESGIGTGYKFENGTTYTFDVTYQAAAGYTFGDAGDIGVIKINNECLNEAPYLYAYDFVGCQVVKVLTDGSQVTVRYTFTMAKTATRLIDKVVLGGYGKLIAGSSCNVRLGYHKCQATKTAWSGNFSNNKFQLGETYKLTVTLTADSGYEFAGQTDVCLVSTETGKVYEPTSVTPNSGYTVLTAVFNITIDAAVAFPEGAGSSAANPAVCSNFQEFQYAMEHDDIRHVALAEFQETLPGAQDASRIPAVTVKNTKHLYLQGITIFSQSVTGGNNYDSLIQVPAGCSLYVYGPGCLKLCAYKVSGSESKNALIHNWGGFLRVYDGTLVGSYMTRSQGVAIWQDAGELVVDGGVIRGENSLPGTAKSVYAAYLNGGSATVRRGTFKAENFHEGQGQTYGLGIGTNASATLEGGTFHGIRLPTDSTPLADYLDETVYSVLSDGQWINPTSPYSQEYTASNKVVRIIKRVQTVSALVNSPMAGADLTDFGLTLLTDGYLVAEGYPKWYKNGQHVTSGTFEPGASYELVLRLMADTANNYEFASDVSASVNGNSAQIATVGTYLKSECISVSYNFGVCPATIHTVALTIDAPKQNGTPDQYVTCGNATYKQALAGDNMFDAPLQWQVSSNGSAWTTMKATDSFAVGKHYRVFIDVMPAAGYAFALDPQLDPAVGATVNGMAAKVSRYPEENPDELICIGYDFGILNDTVIEEIRICGVAEPVVDEKPNYTCAVEGSGYQLDTNYDDAYEDNVIQNGMGWWDYTADNWMKPDDTFQIDHEYKAVFYVKTLAGYEFSTTGKYYEPDGWGYINDNSATFGRQSLAQNNQTLSWVFPCQSRTVKAVGVTVDAPQAGKPLDFTPATDSRYYGATIEWYDEDANELTSADRAIQGCTYRVRIIVEPNEEGGKDLCRFVQDKTAATVNGAQVVKKDWDEVVAGPKRVQIFYTFQCGVSLLAGDMDSDGDMDTDDAVYLLLNVLFGDEDYPVADHIAKDMDGNGEIDTDDAVYLLLHVLFGEEDYPL